MDPTHIARLKEEQEVAYQDTQAKISQWKTFDDDYTAVQDRLKILPDKVTQPVMVPFGKLAFMPGEIIHTNEIMVLLGDNWFAERSAKQACEIIDRRKKQIHTSMAELEQQKRLLGDRLGFTSEFKEISENKEGIVDIQEEYDAEKERLWREERKQKKESTKSSQQAKTKDSKHSSKTAAQKKDKILTKEKTNKNSKETQSKSQKQRHGSKVRDKPVKTSSPPASSIDNESKEKGGTERRKQTVDDESKEEDGTERRKPVSKEEERMWARLDDLEKQEEELDELALLSDYEEEEEEDTQPMFSFTQEAGPDKDPPPKPKILKKQLSRSDSVEKKVQWKDQQMSVLSSSSSSSGSDDEDIVTSTIHFSHTKAESQQESKPSTSNDVTSPADIYNQFKAMQPFPEGSQSSQHPSAESHHLKSIIKPPPPEPVREKPAKQILPQLDSVFSGNVVERNVMATQSDNQPMTDQPPKRVSKFKASRQQKR